MEVDALTLGYDLFKSPCGGEDAELGAAVDLVGDLAMFGVEGVDVLLVEFLTHREAMGEGELLIDDHRHGLAVADRLETVRVDALGDEVIDDRLGATL